MVDFIKWCFKDTTSGVVTIIVLGMIMSFIVGCIQAARGNEVD